MWLSVTKPTFNGKSITARQVLLPLAVAVMGGVFFGEFLSSQLTQLLIGAVAIFLTAKPSNSRQQYAVASAVFMLLALIVPVKTVWYFAAAMALFYWASTQGRGVGFLGLAALIISSPAFDYMAAVFSFPIRIQLANGVGNFFSLFNAGVTVQGNVIRYGNDEFSVDPACMGLYMLSISLLMGISLIGLLQRKMNKRVTVATACLFLLLVFVLNIIANAIRIAVLVQFAILPEQMMHSVVGLLCLLLYVCVPTFFLAKWAVFRGRHQSINSAVSPIRVNVWWQALFVSLLLVAGIRVAKTDTYSGFTRKENIAIRGYTSSLYAPGILKLESDDALVYVKYIRGFYDTDHNPTICWKGSGYAFQDIQPQTVAGQTVYTALLNNGIETLYTAWWYGNGNQCAISQLAWRKDMLTTGSQYAVINVTGTTKDGLLRSLQSIISNQQLKPLFR